ncbi:dienelactone hydrolase family protein [Exilibacterium tricleocarpae]|nr:dienelactone hydrolase family protein [Exilibacterium tricleocarpae]
MSNPCTATIEARDGHQLQGYLAQPEGPAAAGLILLHEIFGITESMKKLAHEYASQGYRVIVPALFDRVAPNTVIPYEQPARGREIAEQCRLDHILMDIEAAARSVHDRPAAVIGFCWGGTYAYLAACDLDISGAVSYYGTRIHEHLHKKPKHPVQFHFGEQDALVPATVLQKIRNANPCQSFYLYHEAGHAFANAARNSFHAASAATAYNRTLDFLVRLFDKAASKPPTH